MPDRPLTTTTDSATVPELPVYAGIALADVVIVASEELAAEAVAVLLAEDVLGFDTESKPTFSKGEVSTGPHLIQLATATRVYLFPVARLTDWSGLKAVLESANVLKVGFGLDSDLAQLHSKLHIEVQNVVDLSRALRSEKSKQSLGAKTAVAEYFGQRLQKSRRTTTSNWANPRLTERQVLYAANDAQVALRVYRAAFPTDPALIERHTPMVRRIAQGLARGLPSSVDTDDLVQDGVVGLMGAVIRFSKETAGRQFEKYVAQRVRGAMLDGLRASDVGTRRVRRQMRHVEVAIQQLGHQLGRAPMEGEVSAALAMPLLGYQRLLQEADGYRLISLEDLGGGNEAGDYLEQCASSEQDPLVVLQRAAFRQALRDALDRLPEQERKVMSIYYEEGRTMRETGDLLGLSEGRISQIHAHAVARLRVAILGSRQQRSLLAPRRQPR